MSAEGALVAVLNLLGTGLEPLPAGPAGLALLNFGAGIEPRWEIRGFLALVTCNSPSKGHRAITALCVKY
jgi:hypothetical protein